MLAADLDLGPDRPASDRHLDVRRLRERVRCYRATDSATYDEPTTIFYVAPDLLAASKPRPDEALRRAGPSNASA